MQFENFNRGGSNNDQIFREITQPNNWDYDKFEQVLSASQTIETYPHKTPETIHFGPLRRFIDDLKRKTSRTGREYARGAFVNMKKQNLVFGKTTEGDENSCRINWDVPEKHEDNYRRTMFFHTHPGGYKSIHFSAQDYKCFLSDPRLVSMLMSCGETELLAVKSAVTPSDFKLINFKEMIDENEKEFLMRNKKWTMEDMIEFNKTVCIEHGLSLYMASSTDKDLARKINLFGD